MNTMNTKAVGVNSTAKKNKFLTLEDVKATAADDVNALAERMSQEPEVKPIYVSGNQGQRDTQVNNANYEKLRQNLGSVGEVKVPEVVQAAIGVDTDSLNLAPVGLAVSALTGKGDEIQSAIKEYEGQTGKDFNAFDVLGYGNYIGSQNTKSLAEGAGSQIGLTLDTVRDIIDNTLGEDTVLGKYADVAVDPWISVPTAAQNLVGGAINAAEATAKTSANLGLDSFRRLLDVVGLDNLSDDVAKLRFDTTNNTGDIFTSVVDVARQNERDNTDWNLKEDGVLEKLTGSNDAFDFIADVANSGLESVIGSLIPGGPAVGATLLGTNVGSRTFKELKEQGASDEQAILGGIASGAFETLFEKLSLGKLLDTVKNPSKQVIKNIVQNTVVNASEEAATELANILYDYLVNYKAFGQYGDIANQVSALRSQGLSDDEIKSQIVKGAIQQIGSSALSGAVMGLGFGLGGSLVNTTDTTSTEAPNMSDTSRNDAITTLGEEFTAEETKPSVSASNQNARAVLQETITEALNEQGTQATPEQTLAITDRILQSEKGQEFAASFTDNVDDYSPYRQTARDVIEQWASDEYTRQSEAPTDVTDLPSVNATALPSANIETQNTRTDSGTEKMRNISRHLNEGDQTYFRTEIEDAFRDNPSYYNVIHNADTWQSAKDIFENNSLDDAYNIYKGMVQNMDPRAVVLAQTLANTYSDLGKAEMAASILEDIQGYGTKAGQFSQAFTMLYLANDPAAYMAYVQPKLKDLSQRYGKDLTLTREEIDALSKVKKGDQKALTEVADKVSERLAQEVPVTAWKKVNELRKLFMLANPRTHIRNIVSNALLRPVRWFTDRVAGAMENGYAILNKDYQRTQSAKAPTKEQVALAKQIVREDMRARSESNKYRDDVTQAVNTRPQTFKDGKNGAKIKKATLDTLDAMKNSRLGQLMDRNTDGRFSEIIEDAKSEATGNVLQNLINADYFALGELEDDPFVYGNYQDRLASYIAANNITSADKVSAEAMELAYNEALKATFKDENWIARTMLKAREALNIKKNGKTVLPLGDILLPFAQTPASLAARSLDYSPVGIVSNSISEWVRKDSDYNVNNRNVKLSEEQLVRALIKGDLEEIRAAQAVLKTAKNTQNMHVSEMITGLAKGVTGTAAIALGMLLQKAGIITGARDDDRDKAAFDSQQGFQEYSIKIGDNYYSYSWAEPVATPIVIGATIMQAIENEDNLLSALGKGTVAAFDEWFELSPLSTISDLFQSYGEGAGSNAISTVVDSLVSSAVPSLFKAFAYTEDTTKRQTTDKTSGVKTALNSIASRIPFLSETLPAQYDTWGNEITRADSTGEAAFANFLNPGNYSRVTETPIDGEIERLYETTGSATVFPTKTGTSIQYNSEYHTLNNKQASELQRETGSVSYSLADEFINSAGYDTLTDEQRVAVLEDLYSFAGANAKNTVFDDYDITSTNYARQYDIYSQYGAGGLVDYFLLKQSLNGSTAADNVIQVLEDTPMDDTERAALFSAVNSGKNPYEEGGAIDTLRQMGDGAVDTYFAIKEGADYDGNGRLKAEEIKQYLNSTNMTEEEKAIYFGLLSTTNNPYIEVLE